MIVVGSLGWFIRKNAGLPMTCHWKISGFPTKCPKTNSGCDRWKILNPIFQQGHSTTACFGSVFSSDPLRIKTDPQIRTTRRPRNEFLDVSDWLVQRDVWALHCWAAWHGAAPCWWETAEAPNDSQVGQFITRSTRVYGKYYYTVGGLWVKL